MKIAYLDCGAGICGSMFAGALLDAGADWEELKKELQKLGLTGYELSQEKILEKGIAATVFRVHTAKQSPKRGIKDISSLIEKSKLRIPIKRRTMDVFWLLARAEAKIHNCSPEEIHFHEVGAVDAVIDIAAVCIALEMLGIEQVHSSPIHLGTGEIKCEHGILPVPVPAVLEILRGMECYSRGIETELVTPTGAALLKVLCTSLGPAPRMQIETLGYGAGERKLPIPNLLRVRLGNVKEVFDGAIEELILLECGLDDINAELLGHLREKLEAEGALEVMVLSAQMKKGRPAHLLRILCRPQKAEVLRTLLFQESTSIGIRSQNTERRSLHREKISVKLEKGLVEVKIAFHKGSLYNIAPEYESCRSYSQKNKIPLKKVYAAATTLAQDSSFAEQAPKSEYT